MIEHSLNTYYPGDSSVAEFDYDKYKKNDDAIEALIGTFRVEAAYYRVLSSGVSWAIVRHGYESSWVCWYTYLRNGKEVCYPFTQEPITYHEPRNNHVVHVGIPILACLAELLPQWAHEVREVVDLWRQPVVTELYSDAPYTSLGFDFAKYMKNDAAVAALLGTWQEEIAMTRALSNQSFAIWSIKRNGYSDSSWVCGYTYIRNRQEICYPFTQEVIEGSAPLTSYLAELVPQWRDEVVELGDLWRTPSALFGSYGLRLQPGMEHFDDTDEDEDDEE
jgi:hypothetical protein